MILEFQELCFLKFSRTLHRNEKQWSKFFHLDEFTGEVDASIVDKESSRSTCFHDAAADGVVIFVIKKFFLPNLRNNIGKFSYMFV